MFVFLALEPRVIVNTQPMSDSNHIREGFLENLPHDALFPFYRVWIGAEGIRPNTTFDLVFAEDTILSNDFLFALFNISTPPNRCITVGGQAIEDQYWTIDEPLIPCLLQNHRIVIRAQTKATCVPVPTSVVTGVKPNHRIVGQHLVYQGGMLGFRKHIPKPVVNINQRADHPPVEKKFWYLGKK